jgi:hypothetical protein
VKARPFRLFVNQFSPSHTRTWAVSVSVGRDAQWKTAREVILLVPVKTVFSPSRYKRRQQPFAWFKGFGTVKRVGDCLVIS